MLRFWFTKSFSRFDLWVVYPVCVVLGVRVSWWWAAGAFVVLCLASVAGDRALKQQTDRELLQRAKLWPIRRG